MDFIRATKERIGDLIMDNQISYAPKALSLIDGAFCYGFDITQNDFNSNMKMHGYSL